MKSKPRLFTAQVLYPVETSYGTTRKSATFENCVMVKSRVAQMKEFGVVPLLLLPRTSEEQALLDSELEKSGGCLNRSNYHHFLPFMLPLGITGRDYLVIDVEENQRIKSLYDARNKTSGRR